MVSSPIFIEEVPSVDIEGGIVHVRVGEQHGAWTPAIFRAFIERGRRKLAEWELAQRPAVRLRSK